MGAWVGAGAGAPGAWAGAPGAGAGAPGAGAGCGLFLSSSRSSIWREPRLKLSGARPWSGRLLCRDG